MSRAWRLLTVIVASSTLIKLAAAWLADTLVFDEYLYCVQAYALLHEGRLPTIFPLTPMLMAGALALIGESKAGFLALNVVVGGLTAIPAYLLGRRVLGDEGGLVVAALTVFSPMFTWCSAHALTEPLFMLLAVYFIVSSMDPGWRASLKAGVVAGLAYLCRYSVVVLVAVTAAYMAYRRSTIEVGAFLASFMAVVASWQLLALTLTGGTFQTERYSIFETLGPLTKVSLGALPLMILKASMGLFMAFLPLILLAPYLKLSRHEAAKFLLALASSWLIVHLGYYAYQSFNVYAAQGHVVAAERVARWSTPIMPILASATLTPEKRRGLTIAFMISIIVSTALGLYLVEYTDRHGMLQLTWEEFLAKLGAGP